MHFKTGKLSELYKDYIMINPHLTDGDLFFINLLTYSPTTKKVILS